MNDESLSNPGSQESAQKVKPSDAHFLKPEDIGDVEVYRFLTAYWLHQDRLSWSRIQTLGVVEIGSLAAAYKLGGVSAAVTLVAGAALVWLLWRLIQRDWENRNQFLESALDSVHKGRGIRMTYEPEHPGWRGSQILEWIVKSLIIVNLVLAIGYALPKSP